MIYTIEGSNDRSEWKKQAIFHHRQITKYGSMDPNLAMVVLINKKEELKDKFKYLRLVTEIN